MRNALLFKDAETFWDFLRLHGSESHNARGYTLYLTQPTGKHARPLLLLLGFIRKRSLLSELTSLFGEKQPQVEEFEDHVRLHLPGKPARDLQITKRRDGTDLLSLVDLVPVRQLEAPTQHVLFWLQDPALMGYLVELCMRLQNDRIQFAPLKTKTQQGTLVRIEGPSFYLLQLFQEKYASQVTLFSEEAPDFYTEWGYRHPMLDLWKVSETPREAQWIFLKHGELPQAIDPVQWQDIYKATDFVLHLHTETAWEEDPERSQRFALPLRFEPRTRPAEAEVWLLEERHRPQLERLLSLMDEEDLDLLLINIQQDQKGKHRFFLREKQRGKGRAFLDFGGTRFASYKGLHHLLFPVEFELQPQLRRDQYSRLFQLQAGVLTFVSLPPHNETPPRMDQATLLRVREDAFTPLRHYIDYLITQDVEQLVSIQQQSLFDFGRYARAPYRPELLQARRATSQQASERPAEKKPQPVEAAPTPFVLEETKTHTKRRSAAEKSQEKIAQRALSELEEEERNLETRLVQQPKRELFSALADLKEEMNKNAEARECLIEALWLHPSESEEETLKQAMREMLQAFLQAESKKAVKAQPPESSSSREAFLFYLFQGPNNNDRIDASRWLQTSIQWLRQHEAHLRKKLRWLVWRELLQQNHDKREMARLRETMLHELNEHGLSLMDLPAFIQHRLMQSRHLLAQEDEQNTRSDMHLALHHMRILQEHFSQLQIRPLQTVGKALVAVGYIQIGAVEQGLSQLQGAIADAKEDPEVDAWVTFIGHSVSSKCGPDLREALQKRKQFHEKSFKKDDSLLEKLNEVSVLLQDSEEKELEEAFSASNLRRLYTDAPIQNKKLRDAFDELQKSHEKGKTKEVEQHIQHVLSMLSDAIRAEGDFSKDRPDYNEIAKTISNLSELLAKLRWTGAGDLLLTQFTNFVKRTPELPPKETTSMMGLFFMLMRLHMAQGLVTFEKVVPAQLIITQSLQWLFESIDYPIDFLDFCGVTLQAVEGLPLHERSRILEKLCENFSSQINDPKSNARIHYEGPSLRRLAYLFQLQLVRVATSKEKLALGLMKQYMDRDEMQLRERILTEDITRPHGE